MSEDGQPIKKQLLFNGATGINESQKEENVKLQFTKEMTPKELVESGAKVEGVVVSRTCTLSSEIFVC